MEREKLPTLPPKAFAKQPPCSLWGSRLVSTRCVGCWQGGSTHWLRHCVREKGAWRSEGPVGMLACVLTQTLSGQPGWGSRWLLAPLLLTRALTPAPLPTSFRPGGPSQPRQGQRETVLDAHPWVWVFCWFPASSSMADPAGSPTSSS